MPTEIQTLVRVEGYRGGHGKAAHLNVLTVLLSAEEDQMVSMALLKE